MIAAVIITQDSKTAITVTQMTPCIQPTAFTYFQRTYYYSDETLTQIVGYTEIDCCYNERTFGQVTQYTTVIDGHCPFE